MEVLVVTPPDKVYDDSLKVLLINPCDKLKNDISEFLKTVEQNVVIYLYDKVEENNAAWLLSAMNEADMVFYDMDFADPVVRAIDGYILSKNKTYWLTQGENLFYNASNNVKLFYPTGSFRNKIYSNYSILHHLWLFLFPWPLCDYKR